MDHNNHWKNEELKLYKTFGGCMRRVTFVYQRRIPDSSAQILRKVNNRCGGNIAVPYHFKPIKELTDRKVVLENQIWEKEIEEHCKHKIQLYLLSLNGQKYPHERFQIHIPNGGTGGFFKAYDFEIDEDMDFKTLFPHKNL